MTPALLPEFIWAHVLAPSPQQSTGGSAGTTGIEAAQSHGAKPALISAQRHQCQTGWDVSSAQCHGGSHGVLSQREIDIISNTQLCREEGEAEKRIPSCTFMGGERDRRLNSALATREEAQAEDAPSLSANAAPGWEGRWILQKGPDSPLFYLLLVRKKGIWNQSPKTNS